MRDREEGLARRGIPATEEESYAVEVMVLRRGKMNGLRGGTAGGITSDIFPCRDPPTRRLPSSSPWPLWLHVHTLEHTYVYVVVVEPSSSSSSLASCPLMNSSPHERQCGLSPWNRHDLDTVCSDLVEAFLFSDPVCILCHQATASLKRSELRQLP